MAQQVVLKSHRVPESSRTLVTREQSLLFVRVHVFQQVKLPVKALVTDVAHKTLFRLLDFLCASVFCGFFSRVVSGIDCRQTKRERQMRTDILTDNLLSYKVFISSQS